MSELLQTWNETWSIWGWTMYSTVRIVLYMVHEVQANTHKDKLELKGWDFVPMNLKDIKQEMFL